MCHWECVISQDEHAETVIENSRVGINVAKFCSALSFYKSIALEIFKISGKFQF